MWSDETRQEILLLQKEHEPFPKSPYETPKARPEFYGDLESARGKVRQLLNSGASCYHHWLTSPLYYHFQEFVAKEKAKDAVPITPAKRTPE